MAMRSLTAGRTGWAFLASRAKRTFPIVILFTALVVTVLYPLLCAPEARTWEAVPKLARYFIETVTFIAPSQPLPGLMDEAKYMCLVQGAMWTLRWGALIYLGVALGWAIGLLKSRLFLAIATIASLIIYFAAISFTVHAETEILRPIIPGLKLGYAFALGMCTFAFKGRLPKTGFGRAGVLFVLGTIATTASLTLNVEQASWVPLADISGSLFWIYAAILALQIKLPVLRDWPNLILGTYLSAWPIAQMILLAQPDITTGVLVALTLTAALMTALAIHVIWQGIPLPKALRRKVAV